MDTPVYDGDRVRVGHLIQGPAIVEERFTTILIPPGWRGSPILSRSFPAAGNVSQLPDPFTSSRRPASLTRATAPWVDAGLTRM